MVLNYNSRKEIIIVQKLKNGERFKIKFEAGVSEYYARNKFIELYNFKNSML